MSVDLVRSVKLVGVGKLVCSKSKVFLFIQQIKPTKINLVILNKALIHCKVIEVIILIVTSSVTRISFKFLRWRLK